MKKFAIISIGLICVIGVVSAYMMSGNWMIRYKSELNQFFGEDNWEYTSKETKESTIYTKYIHSDNPIIAGEVPGKYHNWYILYDNHGEEQVFKMTDHTLKINNDKRGMFSSKRYSTRQAFYLELMHISFDIIGHNLFNEIIRSELSEKEAYPIQVTISYRGGNPKPKFYTYLSKQDWFTAETVTAEHYLSLDVHEFYVKIRAFDYRLDQLTDEERQNVLDSFETIERKLLEKFGDQATFTIYFDKDHRVEYIDGKKIDT